MGTARRRCVAAATALAAAGATSAALASIGAPVRFASPQRYDDDVLATADVNGDGRSDAVATSSTAPAGSEIGVMLAGPGGRLAARRPAGAVLRQPEFVAADFDRDGHRDLVCACLPDGVGPISDTDGRWSVLLGDGHGGFSARVLPRLNERDATPVVADFDRDHRLDVAFLTSAVSGPVLFGDGHGGFGRRAKIRTGPPPKGGVGLEATAVTAADFDADGHPDLAVTTNRDEFPEGEGTFVLFGRGGGRFTAPRRLPRATGEVGDLTVGRFDRGRRPDVAWTRGRGLFVALAAPGRRFVAAPRHALDSASVSGPVAANLDGHAPTDLAFETRLAHGVALQVLRATGRGRFRSAGRTPLCSHCGGGAVLSAHLERRRRSDVVAGIDATEAGGHELQPSFVLRPLGRR